MRPSMLGPPGHPRAGPPPGVGLPGGARPPPLPTEPVLLQGALRYRTGLQRPSGDRLKWFSIGSNAGAMPPPFPTEPVLLQGALRYRTGLQRPSGDRLKWFSIGSDAAPQSCCLPVCSAGSGERRRASGAAGASFRRDAVPEGLRRAS